MTVVVTVVTHATVVTNVIVVVVAVGTDVIVVVGRKHIKLFHQPNRAGKGDYCSCTRRHIMSFYFDVRRM